MKKIYLLPFIFLFGCFAAKAQKGYFVKASIIKKNGDTLPGYIDRVRDSRLSEGITFKQETGSNTEQKFKPGDLEGFILEDEHIIYETVSYQHVKAGENILERRFAILLLKGYCSLYYLTLKEEEIKIIFEQSNDHIFLAKKGDAFTVLRQSEIMDDNTYSLNKDYTGELKKLFSDCSSINENMIMKTEFSKKSMLKIFEKYNLCIQPGVPTQSYVNVEKVKIRVGINASYTFFNYRNAGNSSGISGGFFIAVTNPDANERLSFSAGFNITQLKYDLFYPATLEKEKDNITMYRLPLKGTYYLTRRKIAPFISFGIIPNMIEVNYSGSTGYKHKDSYFTAFSSIGPGISFGKLYVVFLAEQKGLTFGGGTYYNFQLGYIF